MSEAPNPEPAPKKGKSELPHCGVIMPISGSADYPASHWADMLQLIKEAAQDAKYTCEIVSATGRDDIIHASIVTNIYQNEVVICDVSSRNPNVMLELGLRLASKLPIIIIFDGEGNYPFDIGIIRYLGYRRDMRYYDINKFKKELTAKILEVADTHKKGKYQSFLSHFKNIDFDLDSVGTEKQNLTQVLENIGNRLSGLENNKTQQSPGRLMNSAQIRQLVNRSVASYFASQGVTISSDMPKSVLREAYEFIRKDKANVLSTIEPELLLGHIYEWDDIDLPF
jgi:hypothetical protein